MGQSNFAVLNMRLSILLGLTLLASVVNAKPKAKPLTVKASVNVNTGGSSPVDSDVPNGVPNEVINHGVKCEGDVVDVAVDAGTFTTLVKLVTDLGLVDSLKNAEALTIFAPSDEAFANLPPGLLEGLTADEKKSVILRHVVVGKVMAADVQTGPVETLGGEEIYLAKTDAGVEIRFAENFSVKACRYSCASVVKADVEACNGVIHVMDAVIM